MGIGVSQKPAISADMGFSEWSVGKRIAAGAVTALSGLAVAWPLLVTAEVVRAGLLARGVIPTLPHRPSLLLSSGEPSREAKVHRGQGAR